MELVAGLLERPGSQQRHFLQAPKDVFVCSVLIYVQRIRGLYALYKSTFYLLTYLLSNLSSISLGVGGFEDENFSASRTATLATLTGLPVISTSSVRLPISAS